MSISETEYEKITAVMIFIRAFRTLYTFQVVGDTTLLMDDREVLMVVYTSRKGI